LIWRYAAFGWLVFLTALNVYRAATWSMTIDEARVFIDFIASPFQALFTSYDACYHVLHTWLTRFAVGMLGRGEWVVRLPGLVAAVFYFAAVWKLANRMMGAGPLHLLAVVVLSANPLVFDHLSLARGYGLALTLFTWAFYHLVIAASERDAKRITKAAYLMGLSVAANLTFAFPVTGLVVMFSAMWIRREGWRPGEFIDCLLLPMIVPPILILMIPLSRMAPNPFYYGVDRLRTSWQNLFQSSVSPAVYPPEWAKFMEAWVMPVVALLVIIARPGLRRGVDDAGSRGFGGRAPLGRRALSSRPYRSLPDLAGVGGGASGDARTRVEWSISNRPVDSWADTGGAGRTFRHADEFEALSGISGARRGQAGGATASRATGCCAQAGAGGRKLGVHTGTELLSSAVPAPVDVGSGSRGVEGGFRLLRAYPTGWRMGREVKAAEGVDGAEDGNYCGGARREKAGDKIACITCN
jgi:hypothetical protein